MAEFSIPKNGAICWRELQSRDVDASKAFYQGMFGWQLEQSKVTNFPYSEIHFDGKAVGGMMAIDESWGENPPPSNWTTYVAVDDADETVAKITANGGTVYMGPFDAPGVGRIAMASDPAGAMFSVIQFEMPAG